MYLEYAYIHPLFKHPNVVKKGSSSSSLLFLTLKLQHQNPTRPCFFHAIPQSPRSCAAKRASREPARDNADPRSKELENCTEHPAAIVQIGGELGVFGLFSFVWDEAEGSLQVASLELQGYTYI